VTGWWHDHRQPFPDARWFLRRLELYAAVAGVTAVGFLAWAAMQPQPTQTLPRPAQMQRVEPAGDAAPAIAITPAPACGGMITAAQVAKLLHDAATVSSIKAISPDGTRAAVVQPDGSLELLSTKTRGVLWHTSFRGYGFAHGSDARSVAFAPNGTRIVSVQTNGSLLALDQKTGKPIWEVNDLSAQAAAISPDDTRVAVLLNPAPFPDRATLPPSLLVLDLATGERLLRVEMDNPALYAAFSPDGRFIVAKSKDGAEQVWTAENGVLCTPSP